MFTAILAGLLVSFVGIYVFVNYIKNVPIPETVDHSLVEESEEDPTLVARLSDSIIYSADDDFEIRQRPDDYTPGESTKKISAKSYVVMDLETGKFILKKNEDKLLPIASITKLITAVLAYELLDQDEYVTITQNVLRIYGNEAKFRLGEKLRVRELLLPLLMVSSNDSAEAIVSAYSLGRPRYIKEMNSWVNSIGAYKTYFRDPSGLSSQNLSTAEDLALITKWIYDYYPKIFDITLQKTETVRMHTWTSPTHFLNLTAYAGGKNGYTPEANRTSVALFKIGKNQKAFAVIILGSSRRDSDILDLLDEAIR
jgi:D-alanyl-D-alanine carboxypeptidase